jgi:hypothetical protein
VDHINPRTRGGLTDLSNLALACPHCNAHKWAHFDGLDADTGNTSLLFNPRTQHWTDHFEWSSTRPFELEGKTSCGRATIARLQINHPDMVAIRRFVEELEVKP